MNVLSPNNTGISYLTERNCLRDKFSQFSRIFPKFAKLNPREKSTGNQFAKSNPRETLKKMTRENFSPSGRWESNIVKQIFLKVSF